MPAALSLAPPVETPEIPNLPSYVHRTEVGLIIDKRKLSFEEWEAGFEILKKNDKARQWEIGDYLADGEKRFGDDYVQVIDLDEEEERDDDGKGETYRSYQWVSERIPFVHRCTNVPWTLHRDVAAMDAKDRDYWLQRVSAARAAGEKFSRRRLQKEIKAVQNPAKEPETFTEAMQKIHDDAVRNELDGHMAHVDHWLVMPVDPRLSEVYWRVKEILKWQRDRTLETDCEAILKSLTGDEGTEAPERIGERDLAAWLNARGYIMSKDELGTGGCPSRCTIEHTHIEKSGNLGVMVRLKMLTVETREESKGEEQRGAVTSVYALEMDFARRLDKIDELPHKPERVAALQKDWMKRLERYAPELMPKKEAA